MKLMQVSNPNTVLKLIKDEFKALPAEKLSINEAGGRYLAETVNSPEDVPAFNRSTVDGYAEIGRASCRERV